MQDRILIIEDEPDMANLLGYQLGKAGFEVLMARDGVTGLEIARKNRPALVLLDVLLPRMDGYAVCKVLKNTAQTASLPIVMLTAKGEPQDRIKGLEIGADDYLTKPFNLRELTLRIQALLRRLRSSAQGEVLEVDAFRVHRNRFQIQLDGRTLDLTNIEFKLLNLLFQRRGHIQSRDALLFDVFGYENPIITRTVDTHIRRLRAKLGGHAHRLETVRGEGYRFKTISHGTPTSAARIR
jgi:two-component system phosphate regulon response regulator PhoB